MKKFRYFSHAICAAVVACGLASGQLALGGDWTKIPHVTDKQINSLIAKNKGKVLLVNFWATWCPPCVEEFPALVKLYNNYKAKGLEVIGVSMNEQSEMKDVQAFLTKQKPAFSIYFAGPVEEPFYKAIDKRWSSEMPLTMVFDKAGKVRYFHNDACTYAQFEKDVQSLLK